MGSMTASAQQSIFDSDFQPIKEAYQQEDYSQALAEFKSMLNNGYSDNPRLWYWKLRIEIARENKQGAIKGYNMLYEIDNGFTSHQDTLKKYRGLIESIGSSQQTAQEKDNSEKVPLDNVFVVVEEMPELKGGLAAIQNELEYPDLAKKAGIEGRVHVQLIVDKKGQPRRVEAMRGIGGGCDEEAIRVIKAMEFSPGKQDGKPVNVKYSVPVVFSLN
jgi:TonB family protein